MYQSTDCDVDHLIVICFPKVSTYDAMGIWEGTMMFIISPHWGGATHFVTCEPVNSVPAVCDWSSCTNIHDPLHLLIYPFLNADFISYSSASFTNRFQHSHMKNTPHLTT